MWTFDRDLLVLEPWIYRDLAWPGQRVTRGTASVSGVVLLMPDAEVDFVSAGVSEGHVIVVGGVPLEVVSREGPTELRVSRVRAERDGAAIGVGEIPSALAHVVTFLPQIAEAHRRVLAMAGLVPGAGTREAPGEAMVVNGRELARVEALGALAEVFRAGPGVQGGDAAALAAKAARYDEMFAKARGAASLEIDLNGDGRADEVRRLGRWFWARA